MKHEIDIDQVRADLAEEEELVNKHQRRADVLRGVLEYVGGVEQVKLPHGNGDTSLQGISPYAGLTVTDACERVLKKQQTPLPIGEITDLLEKTGFGSELANLRKAAYTGMSRKTDIFSKRGNGHWQLVEWTTGDDSPVPA